MYRKSITKEEMRSLPAGRFQGKIELIDTPQKVKDAVNYLKQQTVLGFDTESRPSFRKGPMNPAALLQLSTSEKAFLFRINSIGLPTGLVEILANKNIIKAGVAIRDDLKQLKRKRRFEPAGFVELQNFVKKFNIENESLAKLAAIVLNIKVSKRQQLSNWEQKNLTPAQMAYAATDAWVSCEIYERLNNSTEN